MVVVFQVLQGRVEHLAGDGRGHPLQCLALILGQLFESAEGLGDLAEHDPVDVAAQLHDGRRGVHVLQPAAELHPFLVDDPLRLDRLPVALGPVHLDHAVQVIDVVEVDVAQVVDPRIQIPRHGDVDEEQGPVAALAHHRTHLLLAQDQVGRAGGADDDVHPLQFPEDLLQAHGPAVVAARQVDRPLQGAVGDNHLGHALADQVLGRQFGHLPGADEQHPLVRKVAENLARQFHRGVADGHGAGADAGFRAHPLGHGKGLVHQLVEQKTGAAALGRVAVGLLQLAENLRLANDHRVQAGGHQKQVLDRGLVEVLVDVPVQFLAGHGAGEQLIENLGSRHLHILAGEQHLDPVAGGQEVVLAHRLQLPQSTQGFFIAA